MVERLRRVVDDPSIELRVVSGEDPSPVSPTDGRSSRWCVRRSGLRTRTPS
ncbi:hypothetical protein NKG05_07850 [Oerskovia sp. M15]